MTKRKIAVVTGGSRGLGRDMALQLAAQGMDVILTYHTRKEQAQEVATEIEKSGGKAAILQLDMSNLSGLEEFVTQLKALLQENWGREKFDYLINNAGIGASVPISQLTEELFERLVNVHFKGVCFLTQKLLTAMNDNGGVVFITAAATRYIVPGYALYAACKSAIEVFARYVAREYGPRGIRANIVAPGGIETDFNGAVIRNNPRLQEFIASQTALGRVGQADDIGGVVAFLCSEDAKWVNGQRIEVTGGMNL